MRTRIFYAFIILLLAMNSCRKDESIITDPSATINLSTSSITFDTVFTTIGSVTKNFRVYNPHKEAIKISSIRLLNGNLSSFRMNVDGQPGPYHQNIEIASKDSMYVFVEVTVDPNNQSNPFVIEDQIEFITNGNRQLLDLVAWGQNAHYFTPTTFNRNLPDYTCLTGPCSDAIPPVNVTWPNDLPYVVYGYVVVDSLDQLNIDPGVRVHFHNNSGLWVYRGGTLKVNGTQAQPVTFQGDRLEPEYRNIPGQWDRIWLNEEGQNEINYAIIKNAFVGIQAEKLPFDNPGDSIISNLRIKNTVIDNCSGYGLLSSLYNIQAENLLVLNAGEHNVAIQAAGNYQFNHCTFANYYNRAPRETPQFLIQNSVINALGTQIIGVPNVQVYNSIIQGNQESEFSREIVNNGSLNLDFQNCLIKTIENITDTASFKNIIQNAPEPIFRDAFAGDFHLATGSAAIDQGNSNFSNLVPQDYDGNSRLMDGSPDLGAYEFKP